MQKQRDITIDFLRGFSILVMILIHTNAYHLSNKIAYLLWDYTQFAVVVFIFCSAYLYFKKHLKDDTNIHAHTQKRIARLLIPYYLSLPVWFAIIYGAKPAMMTPQYILHHFTVTGGMDINWLILLFLIFTLIMPLVAYFWKHSKMLLGLFTAISLGSALVFLSYPFPYSYRWINWLPWSLIIVFTLFFVRFEHKKWFIPAVTIASLLLFLGLRFFLLETNHSIVQYNNKYPPNLYHLSYGLFGLMALYILFKRGFLDMPPFRQFLSFLSVHSYTIYFIHYFVIFFITLYFPKYKFDWMSFFAVVLGMTLVLQWVLTKIIYLLSTLKRGPTI